MIIIMITVDNIDKYDDKGKKGSCLVMRIMIVMAKIKEMIIMIVVMIGIVIRLLWWWWKRKCHAYLSSWLVKIPNDIV